MRITAGSFHRRKLILPKTVTFRPTAEKIRQAIFNILQQSIVQARFLDICAGSGAIGLEAVSRGAAHCTFLEKDFENLAALRKNIELFNVQHQATILAGDVKKSLKLALQGAPFNFIYFDPPYDDTSLVEAVFAFFAAHPQILAADGVLFFETSPRIFPEPPVASPFTLGKRYSFGSTVVYTFQKIF